MDRTADLELTRRVVAGEPDAFSLLYERCLPPVLAFARRRRASRGESEALAEAVLRRVLDRLEEYRPEVPLLAWVYVEACGVWAEHRVREAAGADTGGSHGEEAAAARERVGTSVRRHFREAG